MRVCTRSLAVQLGVFVSSAPQASSLVASSSIEHRCNPIGTYENVEYAIYHPIRTVPSTRDVAGAADRPVRFRSFGSCLFHTEQIVIDFKIQEIRSAWPDVQYSE